MRVSHKRSIEEGQEYEMVDSQARREVVSGLCEAAVSYDKTGCGL